MKEIDDEILGIFNLPEFKNFSNNKSLDNNELIDYMIDFYNKAGYINSQLNNVNGITYCSRVHICKL